MPAPLVDVLAKRGIITPTPIQAATLPDSLAGRDVLGRGRTGSGKTYAFLLPLLARLASSGAHRQARRPRALILAPTRELASQIEEALTPLAAPLGLTSRTVFGGVGQQPQVSALVRGVDVVVACPGRLEDLMKQGHADLSRIEVTVIDEADHMADLGFLPGVTRILAATPADSQRLLFSATLDNGIAGLAKRFLHRPVRHEADSEQSPVAEMTHHVLHVSATAHLPVLVDLTAAPGRTVVFTRTKHRAKKLARQLNAHGVAAVELHGNLSQNARVRTMEAFHSGRAETLVATDIAARGIHVDDVGLVIHADPPVEHKAYLHRSGRTARAGNSGTVVTLMLDDQIGDVRDLTRKAGISPTTTRVDAASPLLRELAPGERTYGAVDLAAAAAVEERPGHGSRGPGRRTGGGRSPQGGGRGGRTEQGGRGGRPEQGGGRGGRTDQAGRSTRPDQGEGLGRRRRASSDASAPQSTGQPRRRSGGQPGRGRGASSGGAAAFSARSSAGRRG